MIGFFIAFKSEIKHKILQINNLYIYFFVGTTLVYRVKQTLNIMIMNNQTEISATELEQIALETLNSMQNGDDEKVVKLFDKVNSIFQRGNTYTQNLVANIFICPLTSLLEMNYSWGIRYLKMLPVQLKNEYHHQIYTSGI